FNSYQAIDSKYSQARAIYRMADCQKGLGDLEKALSLYKKAYKIWESMGLRDLAEQILKPRIDSC
ncbi:MAG: hypothetical protein RBS68_14480, partial [Anaerolineales bacterium]|nr:hypothetical protein [Anaerolineales bacterium]